MEQKVINICKKYLVDNNWSEDMIALIDGKSGMRFLQFYGTTIGRFRYLSKGTRFVFDKNLFSKKADEWGEYSDGYYLDSLTSSESLVYVITNLIERVIQSLSSFEVGCCSQYEKCSDDRMCSQKLIEIKLACKYRSHLENGRIFYGKNRNLP